MVSASAPKELARKLLPAGLKSTGGNMDSAYSAPEDNVVRLFEPDLITPEQHRDRIQAESTDRPEIRLMLAVMEDAVATFQRFAVEPGRRNQRLFDEAESWINSTDTSWPYSFENICAALKFEPESLRRGLENWRKERMNGRSGLYRFPFRRVNGKRHSITLRERHLRQSA
jgi:hypothetical protein